MFHTAAIGVDVNMLSMEGKIHSCCFLYFLGQLNLINEVCFIALLENVYFYCIMACGLHPDNLLRTQRPIFHTSVIPERLLKQVIAPAVF